MRRVSLLCIIIIIISLFLTGCEKNKDLVHVKTSEKEITLYSEQALEATMKVTVTDCGKKEVFEKVVELASEETRTINVNEIAGEYLSEDAVISDAVIEKARENAEIGMAVFCFVMLAGLGLILLVLGLYDKY